MGTTCGVHFGFVAVLSTSPPSPVYKVLIILYCKIMSPHSVRDVRVGAFAVSTSMTGAVSPSIPLHARSQKFSMHLGQCGMYRNHSLNTGLDQSRVWWLLYSNLQPITGSQPLLSWSRFFLIFQRNIGLCLKIMSPLLNHPVFLCVCNNAGILFLVFYHHF